MNFIFFTNTTCLLSFFILSVVSFLHIEKKSYLKKIIFFINLAFLAIINIFIYFYKLNNNLNNLTIISSLLLIIFLNIFLFLSLISHTFLRLRLLFLPFFLILIIFSIFTNFLTEEDGYKVTLFEDYLLITHIISSLFSYSALTISAITSASSFFQEKFLKRLVYNKKLSSLLPSLYEGEILTFRFLYCTLILLLISLFSGYFYSLSKHNGLEYFFNEKSLLSIFTIILIFTLLILRKMSGISSKLTFKIILLSYFFINFSYFGIRLIK